MSDDNTTGSYYNNKNIVLHELIGLHVRISFSRDASRVGVAGTVVNETKNTLVVYTEHGSQRVPKRGSTFIFETDGKSFTVEGEEIAFRPYERIKKGIKFYKRRD